MLLSSILSTLKAGLGQSRAGNTHRRPTHRRRAPGQPSLEPLEDRCCPSGYSVIDLGTLGGTESYATALNAAGQVVGLSYPPGNPGYHAFLWTPGGTDGVASNPRMKELPGLSSGESYALDINDTGQVVGWSDTGAVDASGSVVDFVLWQNGATTDLGIRDFQPSSRAAISNDGVVVGTGEIYSTGATGPFVWQAGHATALSDLLAGPDRSNWVLTFANDVNGSEIVGAGQYMGQSQPFLYIDDDGNFLNGGGAIYPLGTLGGTEAHANAINATGSVAGEFLTARGDSHAFVWVPNPTTPNGHVGTMKDLGKLSTLAGINFPNLRYEPTGINDAGNVVGYVKYFSQGFYWFGKGSIQDLNSLLPRNSPVSVGPGIPL
jgi:probable HAF family extracellular repeat protein